MVQSPHNCSYAGTLRSELFYHAHSLPIRKNVSIVGFEQASTPTAPMDDPSYEIWGLNHANRIGFMRDRNGLFRADRWFDLHEPHAQSVDDLDWIYNCPIPIYLTSLYDGKASETARLFPLEEVIQYGKNIGGTEYYCSSFAYMLVFAAYLGFETIRLDGINLMYGRERLVERANLEFWIGLLRGHGKKIVIPDSSQLLTHTYLYGFHYSEEKRDVESAMAVSVIECSSDPAVAKIVSRAVAERTARLNLGTADV